MTRVDELMRVATDRQTNPNEFKTVSKRELPVTDEDVLKMGFEHMMTTEANE